MDEKTIKFLTKVYREYYFKNSQKIEFPFNMKEREFGYVPFGRGMIRHLTFDTPGALTVEILREAPSSVYCSNATYSHPSFQMDEKEWKSAELIFDIDADSIPSSCKSAHNKWYCQSCNKGGKLPKPEQCPNCHSRATTELGWVCSECLELTKQHVYRLLDFLSNDFGISTKAIRIYFSGNRGYHIHAYDTRFEQLDSLGRGEIANYVKGVGINLQKYTTTGYLASHKERFGWDKRISNTIFSSSPLRKSSTKRVLTEAIERNAALIDQSVTKDIHRIFRMSGTLHGGSGMLKKRVESLENFNPRVDPVALGDEEVQVSVDFCPRFEMKGTSFGPYNSETVKIPTYAAVYMLAKGLARCE